MRALNYAQQIQHVRNSPAWTRLAGIILLVPTEMDERTDEESNSTERSKRTNRQTHTEDVISIAGKIADRFRLNRPLAELIAADRPAGASAGLARLRRHRLRRPRRGRLVPRHSRTERGLHARPVGANAVSCRRPPCSPRYRSPWKAIPLPSIVPVAERFSGDFR